MLRDSRPTVVPNASSTFSTYGPHNSPYIRRLSPPGNSGEVLQRSCCYDHRDSYPTSGESFLCCCYTCPKRSSTSLLATTAVCCLVLGYTILGAFIFMALEGGLVQRDSSVAASKTHAPKEAQITIVPNSSTDSITAGAVAIGTAKKESEQVAAPPLPPPPAEDVNVLRAQTVDRLWSITENLNILYRENWTRLAAEEVLGFQEALFRVLRSGGGYINNGHFVLHQPAHRWTFSSSFLYSLTLITTIGYGSVSPRTSWGKLVTIIYALIGIPLMLLYLSTTGDILARSFRRLYGKFCGGTSAAGSKPSQCPCNARIKVPVSLCLIIVLLYICSGALLFHRLENWSLLEGSYFCFTSLGTIGFGDLLPGQHAEEVSLCACSAYILTGMALVAMCFSLVQDEVLSLLRLVGATCSRRNDLLKDEEAHGVTT